ncbi:MAG: tRNA (N6-isopentenyl adenosine(37)-C2)-methylthiotransferase MiaB [Bacteroidetes bacterium GWE2_39_28]|nr:MAG: tRNA (N6-isopentenyl adenosine(37)-C2)-methylthiotransferase MiaB [Bacteroidetes bacterium GWE2_39_28]OFY12178.1 MAG: tRNA (N6-isopentenyl adenosine(37)-C2)-methylthiotransferase MiaB [Bacteroidetes bacterium GWF2_39_10]OFZ08947.1 MAG: tRNA (N6-isopentenyl adenosine(37)-C2)-methylthiotransferase MiaB [Bacteroidetes bacterium RIFOXYB2_FULL_39_7]OFZ12344.1 MAG: tRNA (N6-isopentenyl adenosine(37)-C2)-methylthiotransferase MiaB [Bacteroidetes bacterium RIFOXYC2_FULL_39_11]HCT94208.1 tRNA (N
MTIKFHSVKPILDNKLKQVYIETYGCQMNVNDSEVVLSVLQQGGYSICDKIQDASLILINTCSIRDNAEQRIWARIKQLGYLKRKKKGLKIGILGCMAERLKEKLLENGAVDIVAGPDSYRELPSLIEALSGGDKQINTMLSQEETYADISPVRMDKNGVSAYISIMRGCNNFCSYCVVPYVRGRERSRNPQSIINEARELFENGYKEVTLLGQNVNSYLWEKELTFAKLLEMVAQISPQLRVRFSTSHPKDMDDSVLHTIAAYENICRHIHLPIQSGSNDVLKRMNRKYTREEYLAKVKKIKEIIPESTISTDMIAGFSGETEADHLESLSVMREVGYYTAFMFQYSERPDTKAAEMYPDDVPHEIKNRRLNEIIALQNELSHLSNKQDMDKVVEVLVEGTSKRSTAELVGRTSQNKICVFPAGDHKVGDYVKVKVTSFTSATLKGNLV